MSTATKPVKMNGNGADLFFHARPGSPKEDLTDTDNVRVESLKPLIPPSILVEEELPLTPAAHTTVLTGRRQVTQLIKGEDDRLLVIVGPCSIHDPVAAMDYARRLKPLAEKFANELLVVMRVYFEKPRTTVGWKGLINDPDLNGSYHINKGLRTARKILLDINELGLPAACEFLDTISPQFTADLVSWGAIGARTTESQIHRELASGLSCPIGFKNGTDGNVQIAIDAVRAAAHQHSFLGVTKQGLAAIVNTKGNDSCHIILRGANTGPNYSAEHVGRAAEALSKAKLLPRVMVDCSHGNSQKDHNNQPKVAEELAKQISSGSTAVMGVMIESNIVAGRQDLGTDPTQLVYGQSITDACVDLETTEKMLATLAQAKDALRKGPRSGQ